MGVHTHKHINILAIETSCDDTSAAVLRDNVVLSNVIANQKVHEQYGGVVPELASRAHQSNIIPVIHTALHHANITKKDLHAVAVTRGPGLLGSLLVGVSFARSFAKALGIPLIDVHHLEAHIWALFIDLPEKKIPKPEFPFLSLIVSGGHTKLVIVRDFLVTETIGETIDDAAGEAFDKAAKMLGLPYPGGPHIDRTAQNGNPYTFEFSKPNVQAFNFSFSGMKTSFLYFLRDKLKENKNFINEHLADLCASIQHTIVSYLLEKTTEAARHYAINQIAIVGGVSANSYLKKLFNEWAKQHQAKVFFPEFQFTTDNAAMVGMVGYLKYRKGLFAPEDFVPFTADK